MSIAGAFALWCLFMCSICAYALWKKHRGQWHNIWHELKSRRKK